MIEFADAPVLTTERLVLRPWRASDLAPYAALNADAEVMRYFPDVLSREESDAHAALIQDRFRNWGFGFWAVEARDKEGGPGADFMGFVGLAQTPFKAHFTPAIEIGWRFARPYWGLGYASEGARAALRFGFDVALDGADADEIVAFAPAVNAPSRAVMERIGMTRAAADDFVHPDIAEQSPLQPFVLYRMSRKRYDAKGEKDGEARR